jgi:precorrin-2/cobalt-factor-2 C20-methyltransferase
VDGPFVFQNRSEGGIMPGTLFGIGVGPGDPELLTLKAVKVLGEVSHVFAASSSKNDYSLAESIVAAHLPPGVPVERLSFPMTYNPESLENAWTSNCEKITRILLQGDNVAFLTIGDPLTFSTFIYIMRKIQNKLPEIQIRVIPGITSFQAAAACARVPLAEGDETITVMSMAKGENRLEDAVNAENIVLLKTYGEFPRILSQIKEKGLENDCCFISRCGLEGEIIERDFDELAKIQKPHYLSLMIIKKNGRKKD